MKRLYCALFVLAALACAVHAEGEASATATANGTKVQTIGFAPEALVQNNDDIDPTGKSRVQTTLAAAAYRSKAPV